MAEKGGEVNPYLRRPLYVYDLPPDLLSTLTLRTAGSAIPELTPNDLKASDEDSQTSTTLNEDGISSSTSCKLCRVQFNNVATQREHVRSDFHRYNLKLSIRGSTPVDEKTFVTQIGDLDESISGSDSSESETNEDNQDANLRALLRKQAKISLHPEEHGVSTLTQNRSSGGAPLLWLSSPKTGDGVGLGVYKAILSNSEQEQALSHLVNILKTKQLKPVLSKQGAGAAKATNASADSRPHFFLCMIGGGHFAAAIIELAPELRNGPGGVEERHAIVTAHKTFHRYTTRRKQGGSQSANDNAKGNAHSAGSSIRRYNEMALEADVRNILTEWRPLIDTAELLFVRASGTTGRRTLFGQYDGQVLSKTDSRLRGFPFSTRRATQGELLRSFQELTRVKVSTFTEPVAQKDSESKPKLAKPKAVAPERTKEEEAALLHTSQIQNLARRTKAPGLLLYLSKNDLSPDFEFHPASDNHHSPRPLHLSASINSAALVTALLMKANANPTFQNGDGKTPYDLAGESRTRDAFRVARHQLGENAWDWTAAHVPSPISPEEAEAKAKKEQASISAAEAERRRADLEKIRQQEENKKVGQMERKAGMGKTLGAVVEKTGSEKREEEMRGLTPEMRQRLERERRARAAEARFKAMSGGQ